MELYQRKTSTVGDQAKRRELKIKQYQKEKELRIKVEVRSIAFVYEVY